MYRILANLVVKDNDLPDRAWKLDVLNRFLDGSIYDSLEYEFHQERTEGNEYIPIAKRAPSVRYNLLGVVVNDSISFLFAEGRWPGVDVADDEAAEDTFRLIEKDCALNQTMIEAAQFGSVGSVCLWVRVLSNRLFIKALKTTYLTPIWKAEVPDTLEKVVELYKTTGKALRELGYAIQDKDLNAKFWFRREWDEARELWFVPKKVGEDGPQVEDQSKTVNHGLGFVPMVWIKNLPGGDDIDGASTFQRAIEDSLEIDYQLSQAGRGLKYSSSPTLVMKDPVGLSQARQHVVGDALIIPPEGDAKLLELSGTAVAAVIEFVREVRKLALESVGGSRADSDKLSAATSGRAMELMNQSLINLADKLRSTYGEHGLLKLLKMAAAITRKFSLVTADGEPIPAVADGAKISLVWPRWYAPTSDDRQADATAITTLKAAGVISTETAVNSVAADYDIEDVDDEVQKLDADSQKALEREMTLNPPIKPAAKNGA